MQTALGHYQAGRLQQAGEICRRVLEVSPDHPDALHLAGLLARQEGWSHRIIEFVGLGWDERCLNFHETERKVGTASNWQVRQKIYKTSKALAELRAIRGPLIALAGARRMILPAPWALSPQSV